MEISSIYVVVMVGSAAGRRRVRVTFFMIALRASTPQSIDAARFSVFRRYQRRLHRRSEGHGLHFTTCQRAARARGLRVTFV